MNFDNLRVNDRLLAFALILLGVLFLGGRFFDFNIWSELWPFFVILPGLPFLYLALRGGKAMTGLIFPGIVIVGTGLILLYQNVFNVFESWTYMWAAYPIMVGLGMRFQGKRLGNKSEVTVGRSLIFGGGAILLAFGFLFEFLIFNSILGGITGFLLPLLLIAGGVFLLYRRGELPMLDNLRREKPKRTPSNDEPAEAARTVTVDAPARVEEKPKNDPTPSVNPYPKSIEERAAALRTDSDTVADAGDDDDISADAGDDVPEAGTKPRRHLTGEESAAIDPDLQRRIDEALAESDSNET